MSSKFWHVWSIPIGLGILSTYGLLSALVGDDVWDWLSWITLAIPLVVITRFVIKPQARKSTSRRS